MSQVCGDCNLHGISNNRPTAGAFREDFAHCNGGDYTSVFKRAVPNTPSKPAPSRSKLAGSGTAEFGAMPASANNTDSGIVSSGAPGRARLHEGSTSKPKTGSLELEQEGYEMQPVKMKSRVFVVPAATVTEKLPNWVSD